MIYKTQPLSACCGKPLIKCSTHKESECSYCREPCDIATPDTEEWTLDVEIKAHKTTSEGGFINGLTGAINTIALKDFIRQLIRTEKLKVLEQVKLEKPESAGVNDFQNGVYSGYLNAIDDLNAIREKLRKNI